MTEFLTLTKGYGIINHTFSDYRPMEKGSVGERKNGALVSMENGKATNYGLMGLKIVESCLLNQELLFMKE